MNEKGRSFVVYFFCAKAQQHRQSPFCPQTKAGQMNVIFVPRQSNPCCMASLSNSRGLFPRLFFMNVWLEWQKQSVANVQLRCGLYDEQPFCDSIIVMQILAN